MADNYVNRDSFMNIKGTTCKSFTIGQTSISFASSAVKNPDDVKDGLSEYKRLVVKNDGKKKVIYDEDIDLHSVSKVESLPNNAGCKIYLLNGDVIQVGGSASGISAEIPEGEETSNGELVVFNDTTGKVITRSGVSILKDSEMPTYGKVIDSIDELNSAYEDWFGENGEVPDDKIPTMRAVATYVGSIGDVLKLRTDGNLPNTK